MEENHRLADNLEGLPSQRASINYGLGNAATRYVYDTIDRQNTTLKLESCQVDIHDAAAAVDQFTLETTGFMLAHHESRCAAQASSRGAFGEDLADLSDEYHREVIPFIQDLSGSDCVLPQDSGFLIRHSQNSNVRTLARPAAFAHCDFTAETAREISNLVLGANDMAGHPHENFAIVQTWRTLSPPPQDSLLAMCDGRTVSDQECSTLQTIVGPADEPGSVFFNKLGRKSDNHRWYYFSNMGSDSLLVFLAYDSRRDRHPNVLHTAFTQDIGASHYSPRVSLEARFFAYF